MHVSIATTVIISSYIAISGTHVPDQGTKDCRMQAQQPIILSPNQEFIECVLAFSVPMQC